MKSGDARVALIGFPSVGKVPSANWFRLICDVFLIHLFECFFPFILLFSQLFLKMSADVIVYPIRSVEIHSRAQKTIHAGPLIRRRLSPENFEDTP